MKVLIAVHHFPPRFTGGAEWRAYRTAAALKARGHNVRVICIERTDSGHSNGVTWDDETYDGVPVRRLSFDLSSAPDPFHWEYDNRWIGQHLQAWMTQEPPDVFHLIGGYLMTARVLHVAKQLGIPTVLTLTDFWFLCPRISMLRSDGRISSLPIDPARCTRCLGEERRRYLLLGRIAPRLMDKFWRLRKKRVDEVRERLRLLQGTLNQVDAIISPSQFLRSTFIYSGIAPERIVFSRQGRDFPHHSRQDLRKSHSTNLRVGYLGQIAWHKGVHVLFEAVRQIPNARLRVEVYGDPTKFPRYARRLNQQADGDKRLLLPGAYISQELTELFRDLDVIVVPSLWYENSPNVILEAFAHRTPVIASNLGGMAELVRDELDGLLFGPGDARVLARQLQRLLDDRQLLPSLRRGIGPVKSVAEEMDELEEIYRAVVQHTFPQLAQSAP